MALTSLASLSLSNLMDHFDKMEDVLSESIAPSLKLCLFPLLCKRGLVHDRNISKFVHNQTTELDLADCEISDKGLAHIHVCHNLQVISLNSNKGVRNSVSSEGLQQLFKSCPYLKSVHLKRCVNIDDSCVTTLAESCRGLTHLNIHGCESVGDGGLVALANNSSYLESLDMSRTSATEDGIVVFANGCSKSKLQELNMSHCSGPTDHAVHQLIENCPRLKMLMLHSCPNVTGESRELISQQTQQTQRKFKQITWTISF